MHAPTSLPSRGWCTWGSVPSGAGTGPLGGPGTRQGPGRTWGARAAGSHLGSTCGAGWLREPGLRSWWGEDAGGTPRGASSPGGCMGSSRASPDLHRARCTPRDELLSVIGHDGCLRRARASGGVFVLGVAGEHGLHPQPAAIALFHLLSCLISRAFFGNPSPAHPPCSPPSFRGAVGDCSKRRTSKGGGHELLPPIQLLPLPPP